MGSSLDPVDNSNVFTHLHILYLQGAVHMFTQLYLMELYFGGILLIVKKLLKFRKE